MLSKGKQCGVRADTYPGRPNRFDVVYHLLSPRKNHRIRIKVATDAGAGVDRKAGVYRVSGQVLVHRERYVGNVGIGLVFALLCYLTTNLSPGGVGLRLVTALEGAQPGQTVRFRLLLPAPRPSAVEFR